MRGDGARPALDTASLFPPPDGPRPGAPAPRRCRRHEWALVADGSAACLRCGRPRDDAASRRGRANRQRGNSIEREVCARLGIRRVGQFGGPDDGGSEADWITVQVKSGGAYPERIDALLRALPSRAGQLRAVVHADAPGRGQRRRALITLDLGDFADWFGGGREATR